ncbi:MAG: YihY/virulence factor BrkB family protein [Nitrolancea sp.]
MHTGQFVSRARRIYAVDVLYRAMLDFTTQNGSVYAAAISYYALFSLFPMVILVATVFGWFSRGTDLQTHVINAIVNQLPPGAGFRSQVESVVKVSATQGGILSIVGFAGTLWTSGSLFSALRRGLNAAFDIPTARPFITGRLSDVLSALAVGVLLLLSLGATAALGIARAVSSDFFRGPLVNVAWAVVFFLFPFILSYAVFILIYRLIPNRRLHPRDLRVGALLCALGFEFVKLGFTIYVANFGSYQQVYGALGGVVAFLFFVYLESTIVILSAEIASELSSDRALAVPRMERPRTVSPAS